MRVIIDTNVLLRFSQPRHVFHAVTTHAVDELLKAGHELRLVPQVLYEYWAVATRSEAENGAGLPIEEVTQRFAAFKKAFPVLRDERGILEPWERLVREHSVRGKQAHDARLVAAMQRHGIKHLLTLNPEDFRRYFEIVTVDPRVGSLGLS
jgi:predicted nucleic acid-binding protein